MIPVDERQIEASALFPVLRDGEEIVAVRDCQHHVRPGLDLRHRIDGDDVRLRQCEIEAMAAPRTDLDVKLGLKDFVQRAE